MSMIKSRKHKLAPHALAALAASLSLPVAAQQASADAKKDEAALPTVKVQAAKDVPFKADVSASSKITQTLLETPKTIQVVKKETLQEQGAVSLMEALQNTPGITMQLGENGNTSAGDTFQMRGFSLQTSTFVDGVRDLGAVTRDVFNLEQIEIVKGPAGADTGRGASAGYINLISKLPQLDTITDATVTLGDASRKRATLDTNLRLGESIAARVNVMAQDNGVPGRDFVKKKGWAIAPSVAFGLGTPTRFYLFSQHVRQDNKPDGGMSTIGFEGFYNATAEVRNATRRATSQYYGSSSDYEKIDADMVTAKLEMDLGGGTTIRNISRYGRTHMDRVLTGINAITAVTPADPSTWTISRSRQRVNQTNEILANQTSLNTSFTLAGMKHDLATGIELMHEQQLTLGVGTTAQTINGVTYAAVAAPAANLYNPNRADAMGTPYLTGADSEGKTTTQALYAFDTVSVTDALKLNAGLRYEHFNISTLSSAIANNTINRTSLRHGDWITSWNVGATYKLADNGTVYAAAANSVTPPGSANFTLSASGQAAATAEPQETSNYEIGTKWELLDKRLNVSAALYRTENDKQVTQDPVTQASIQNGKTRVEGIELAAVGQITNFWQITAGLQTMKIKQLNQQSVNSTTGVVTVTDGVRWSPDFSATLWTSYQWGDLTVGGGARHMAEQKRVVTVAAAGATPANTPNLPAYTVFDLMAAYRVSKLVNLQLNVANITDKVYMQALNNGGSRLFLGAPRSATVTARFSF
ncbi:TonB-dependent siderophore receptor [Roseateles asaccharophilus]|uniref:Catecholate siderophore receptor n=1 Tax=Roseateles asaccharophilus TaxID=582607 RepID=A0ABU2A816_9BURK|nr:TonB-dependent siderophore receptor [Roseateles asaccharophilus]MDR7333341.1 catecholate siderophore receptor [Roseateles asaccharophilus]